MRESYISHLAELRKYETFKLILKHVGDILSVPRGVLLSSSKFSQESF
jgi:hypothetical protein